MVALRDNNYYWFIVCVWLAYHFVGSCRVEWLNSVLEIGPFKQNVLMARQTITEKGRSSVTRKIFSQRSLLSSLSGFCLRSGLVSNHSLPLLSFNLSRSLSLCFFDFFFLCWLLVSCWWAQSESLCGGWCLLNLLSCSLLSEACVSEVLDSLCISGKPFCPTGKPLWLPVRLLVRWNSVFVWKLGTRGGAAVSCLLEFKSPFTVGCCCNLWSTSFCLLTASLSSESKGTGRFWGRKKKIQHHRNNLLPVKLHLKYQWQPFLWQRLFDIYMYRCIRSLSQTE